MKREELHQTITNQIINDLEQGQMTWIKPFNGGGLNLIPRNPSSGKQYQGINTLILWMTAQQKGYRSGQWLTFKQALDLGYCVRKGEKAAPVVFFKTLTLDKDSDDERNIPMLRQYSVFNIEQLDGAESLLSEELGSFTPNTIETITKAEQAMSIATVEHAQGNQPCFIPSRDIIKMPLVSQFKSQLDYYATALHELTHWTGHKDRLNRFQHTCYKKHEYAFEELVAELGAAFLCAEFGLEYTSQHAAYIQSWLKALKNDNTLIFKAAAAAQRAINLIKEKSNLSTNQETENQNEGAA